MSDALRALCLAGLLTGCVAAEGFIDTDEGRLRVDYDPDVARFSPVDVVNPDGTVETISPFPAFGALVVTRPGGPPLGVGDRALVEGALQQHCDGKPVSDLSLRGETGEWSSAPCGGP